MAYAGPFFCSLLMTTITMSCGPDVDDVTSVYASAWRFQTLCTGCLLVILLFAVSLWCSIIIIHMHMMHHNY